MSDPDAPLEERLLRDLTQPGDLGSANPRTPSEVWPYRMTWHNPDGTWKRIGVRVPRCGQLWILDFDHFERVPGCAGLNYAGQYRTTLLRAFAEAFRFCRERDAQCPDARLWMLSAHWGCVIDADARRRHRHHSRLVAARLTETFGQNVVVDNRGGGNVIIGTSIAAKAPPDGYTLLMATNASHAINPELFRDLPYHSIKDFTPIVAVAYVPTVLVVTPGVPGKERPGFPCSR